MNPALTLSAPIVEQPVFTPLDDNVLHQAGATLLIWRLDQIPGVLSGNKVFKLRPGIAEGLRKQAGGLASFGGAWSNHLHALAAAGRDYTIDTLGVVRGDAAAPPSAMLLDAMRWGMRLHFLSRTDYRHRRDPGFLAELQAQYPGYHWLPEGGSDLAGVRGCEELGQALSGYINEGDVVAVPVGSGGTIAGLLAGLGGAGGPAIDVVGYSALKGADFLETDIRQWLRELSANAAGVSWKIEHRFHGGGYGKCAPDLQRFIVGFYQQHGIALDPVYNGKMLWGLYQQLAAGELKGRRIIALHTGGLQGLRGYPALFAEMTQMGFQGLQ